MAAPVGAVGPVRLSGPAPVPPLIGAVRVGGGLPAVGAAPSTHLDQARGETDYADSTVGLQDDADEAAVSTRELATVATWRACRALARRAPDYEQSAWRAEELAWEVKAAAYLQWGRGGQATPLGGPSDVPLAWAKGWSPG